MKRLARIVLLLELLTPALRANAQQQAAMTPMPNITCSSETNRCKASCSTTGCFTDCGQRRKLCMETGYYYWIFEPYKKDVVRQ
jgi:hypothetical protein